jgi:hypothetical protein
MRKYLTLQLLVRGLRIGVYIVPFDNNDLDYIIKKFVNE